MEKQLANTQDAAFVAAKLPIDRELIKSRRLLNMIELVEVLKAPDGVRTLWQLFVDAGAEIDHIVYRDVDDDRLSSRSPALQFRVNSSKLKGFLVIEDDAEERCFRVLVQSDDSSISKVVIERVFIRNLSAKVASLIDDGTRRWNDEVSRLIIKE
jgi:hypothetical protein